jgi:hypothetical protein
MSAPMSGQRSLIDLLPPLDVEKWGGNSMSEASESSPSGIPANAVMVPKFCEYHQHDLVVRRLKLSESDAWMVSMLTVQILCFTWATADPRINARLPKESSEPSDLSLILAEVGCLACFDGEGYDRAAMLVRRGLPHAVDVAHGRAKGSGLAVRCAC